MSALGVQVGGDHYKKYKIQPMEYSMANGLDACQHTAIKYVTRFRDKGGVADLEKAKHCIDMLIEFERKGAEKVKAGLPEGWTDIREPRPPFAVGAQLELMTVTGEELGTISYTPEMSFAGIAAWRFGVPLAPPSRHQSGCTEKCAASICPCNDRRD